MAESMIERVARAIFEAEYTGGEADEYRWERSSSVYFAQARAAIEAMREVLPAMAQVAMENQGEHITRLWPLMIDAALNEQVPG